MALPLSKANKIKKCGGVDAASSGDIAAIDFGTTFCSLAYIREGDEKIITFKLDGIHQRVPNAVLLKQDDHGPNYTVAQFGYMAQEEYSKMRASSRVNYIYFERIKMILERDKTLDRQSIVESFNGQKFYLVELIAFILKHLRDQLENHLHVRMASTTGLSFNWVITVPAIWKANGKRMMREAAYMAGLLIPQSSGCSVGITKFTKVGRGLPRPDEINQTKLTLALEPESGAIYSQHDVSKAIVSSGIASQFKSKKYMVIDVGGGTVDITAHHEDDGGIEVIVSPTGNCWGGTKVNEEFVKLLEAIVDDKGLDRFLASTSESTEKQVIHKIIFNKIVYNEFEQQKITFGENVSNPNDLLKVGDNEICIDLPSAFVGFYGDDKIQNGASKINGVSFEDDSLYITYRKMSELFANTIEGIVGCALQALEHLAEPIGTIYLVGGFGGCRYVHGNLKHAIDTKFSGHKPHIIVPTSPSLAIATGAVMWRKDPSVIKARRSDATYGTACAIPFDGACHNKYYCFFDQEDNIYRTNNVFCVFLEANEKVSSDEIFTQTLLPSSDFSRTAEVHIYSTPSRGIQYVIDENGKFNVRQIGKLVIDIPNPSNLPKKDRGIEITMDFSGTEIQAKAKYCVTGEEVSTVCDFLTAYHTNKVEAFN